MCQANHVVPHPRQNVNVLVTVEMPHSDFTVEKHLDLPLELQPHVPGFDPPPDESRNKVSIVTMETTLFPHETANLIDRRQRRLLDQREMDTNAQVRTGRQEIQRVVKRSTTRGNRRGCDDSPAMGLDNTMIDVLVQPEVVSVNDEE